MINFDFDQNTVNRISGDSSTRLNLHVSHSFTLNVQQELDSLRVFSYDDKKQYQPTNHQQQGTTNFFKQIKRLNASYLEFRFHCRIIAT